MVLSSQIVAGILLVIYLFSGGYLCLLPLGESCLPFGSCSTGKSATTARKPSSTLAATLAVKTTPMPVATPAAKTTPAPSKKLAAKKTPAPSKKPAAKTTPAPSTKLAEKTTPPAKPTSDAAGKPAPTDKPASTLTPAPAKLTSDAAGKPAPTDKPASTSTPAPAKLTSDAAGKPAPTDKPASTSTPAPSGKPATTSAPAPTDKPASTSTPAPAKLTSDAAGKPAPTDKPASTSTPAPSGKPATTSAPAPTDKPASTSTPAPSSKPATTSAPAPTDKPASTSTPAPTDKPASTSTPAPTEKPAAEPAPAPTGKPTTKKMNIFIHRRPTVNLNLAPFTGPPPIPSSPSNLPITLAHAGPNPLIITLSLEVRMRPTSEMPNLVTDTDRKSAKRVSLNVSQAYFKREYHGLFSLMGTLLLGLNITFFRLLARTDIKLVKTVHLIFHIITLLLFAIGLWCELKHENEEYHDRLKSNHSVISWMTFAFFCLQFLLGITSLRQSLAYLHDIIGIWIYVSFVLCCITGKSKVKKLYVDKTNEALFCGLSHFCFMLILIIILSPYFEWDFVTYEEKPEDMSYISNTQKMLNKKV